MEYQDADFVFSKAGNNHRVVSTYGDAPKWKKLSALPKYQLNTSNADVLYLVPPEYDDL